MHMHTHTQTSMCMPFDTCRPHVHTCITHVPAHACVYWDMKLQQFFSYPHSLCTLAPWTPVKEKRPFFCPSLWEWVGKLGVSLPALPSGCILSSLPCGKGEADSNRMKMRAQKEQGTEFKMSVTRPLRPKPILKMACLGWPEPFLRN